MATSADFHMATGTDGQRGDAQLIDPPAGAAGFIYVDEFTALPVKTYATVQVVGETSVCSDGYTTGEDCGNEIRATDQCLVLQNQSICGLIVAFNLVRSPATRPGDSGGPVFNHDPVAGGLNVRGIINCNQVQDPRYWCYTPAQVLVDRWGAVPLGN